MEQKEYLEIEDYRIAADSLYAVSGMVLFGFANHNCDTKDIIIRNFLARAAMSIKSIFLLWDANDFQNAWVIFRSLVDRMFHLHSLGTNDNFDDFDDWSFFEQYKSQNRVKSDLEFKHEAVGWIYELTEDQSKRIKHLSNNKPQWRRPKAESVAKDMDMEFLYKYGYDYASMHVHPMSSDGQQDFYTITKLEPCPKFPSQISVISNTVLTASMIVQDALHFSSFKWHRILWDYLDDLRKGIDKGDVKYQVTFFKLSEHFKSGPLCQPN